MKGEIKTFIAKTSPQIKENKTITLPQQEDSLMCMTMHNRIGQLGQKKMNYKQNKQQR
jgi:hypothetical protein